jgi:tetratricopeptide (TPR) repeat protein
MWATEDDGMRIFCGPSGAQPYSSLCTLFNADPEYGLLLARAQIGAGKASAALTTLSQLDSRTLPLGPEAQVDLLRAEAQQFLANYREQLSAANSAVAKAKSLVSNLLLARARVFQCWATMYLGSPAEAKPLCEEASKLNTQSGDQLGIARAGNQIANAYYSQGDLSEARPLYEQAATIAQTIGDKLDEAGALTNIANIKKYQGDRVGAKKAYEESIVVSRDRGDKSGQALAQQNLAALLYDLGDSRQGTALFQQAIKLANEIGDKRTEALALNNLCMASFQGGELERALKSCEGSLRMRSEMGDAGREARSRGNLGYFQVAQGNLSGAGQSYQEALKTQKSLGQKGDAAYSQISLATLALEEKKPEDAKKLAQEAVTELADEKDVGGEAQGRGTLALALLDLGATAGAETQIEQDTNLVQQANARNLKLMTAIAKARIDGAFGKNEEALKGLASVEKEALAAGLVAIEFEARLALGEIERKAGQTAPKSAAA